MLPFQDFEYDFEKSTFPPDNEPGCSVETKWKLLQHAFVEATLSKWQNTISLASFTPCRFGTGIFSDVIKCCESSFLKLR